MFKRHRVKSCIKKGDIALSEGNLSKAESHYRQALDIDPISVESIYSLGAVSMQRREWVQAIQFADDTLAIEPQHAGAWTLKGNALLGLERWAEAIEALERSEPGDLSPLILGQIGLCHEGLGDIEAAEIVLRQALSNDPSYTTRFALVAMFSYSSLAADLHHFLGRVLQKKGLQEEAKLHYHLAKRNDGTIELDPIYLEIGSDGELDNHPYFDSVEGPPEDLTEHLIWLTNRDSLPTREQFPPADDEVLLDRMAALVYAAQKAGEYHISAKLRLVGDVLCNSAKPTLFQTLLSLKWCRFFELVERVNEGEIEENEALEQISQLSFDAGETQEMLLLTRRFITLHPESALVLAGWVARLLRLTTDPSHAIQGTLLHGFAQSRCLNLSTAETILKEAYHRAYDLGARRQIFESLTELADHYVRSGENELALEWVDKAAEHSDSETGGLNPQTRYLRTQLLLNVGRAGEAFDEGVWLLQHAADVEPFTQPGDLFNLLTELSTTTSRQYPVELMSELSNANESVGVQKLLTRAQAAAMEGNLQSSLALFDQAEESGWQAQDRGAIVHILALKAQTAAEAEDLDQAEISVARALYIAEQVADRVDSWSLAMLASNIAAQRGDDDQAQSRLEIALSEARRLEDRYKQTKSLRALSSLLIESDPDRAVQLFGESVRIDSDDEAETVDWQNAQSSISKGDWPAVIVAYDRLLADNSAIAVRLYPEALANRAIARIHLGNEQAALVDFESAAEIFLQRGKTIRAIEILSRVATMKSQDRELAMMVLEHAREQMLEEPSAGIRRTASTHLAEAAFETGHIEFAEDTAKPALQIALSKDWRDSRDEINLRHVLAKVARCKANYPEALEHYREGIARAEYLKDDQMIAQLRGNRAIVQRFLGQFNAAIIDYEYAINFARKRGDTSYLANLQYNMVSTLFLLRRDNEAISIADQALKVFDVNRDTAMAERTLAMLGQYASNRDLPEELQKRIANLAHSDKPSADSLVKQWRNSIEAHDLFEQGKPSHGEHILRRIADEHAAQGDRYNEARTILGLSRMQLPSTPREAIDNVMQARVAAADLGLTAMLTECDELLLEAAMQTNDETAVAQHLPHLLVGWRSQRMMLEVDSDRLLLADRSASLMDRLAAWQLENGRLHKALEAQDLGRCQVLIDKLGETLPVRLFPIEKMQALLMSWEDGATMLALTWINNLLYAFTLSATDRSPHVRNTGLDRQAISKINSDFEREVLRYRGESSSNWERLAAPLLSGIDERLPKNGTVVLVLEEELQSLPIHALRLDSGERLLQRAAVVYAPSMQLLSILQARPTFTTESTGNRLVAAGVTFQDEALALMQRFGGLGLTSRHLDKTALETHFENARFIHLACHGYFDQKNHLESGLVISDTTEPLARDVLSARELMEWGIAADLVVLSACETGRGIPSASEFLGLGRALVLAGARSTITALWKVENRATVNLMLSFYGNLFDQQIADAAQALRYAQLEAAQTQGLCDWAAFKLTGWPLYGEINHD